MKIDLRWQILLAAICAGLILSLLGFQLRTSGICTATVPSAGGKLVEGMIGQPRWINPLLSHSNPVDQQLSSLIFDGLARIDEEGQLEPALAQSWTWSEDGRTLSVQLRDDFSWHDGRPLTAGDVAFTYGLLKDENFPVSEALRSVWQSVAISQTGEFQIDFILPQTYGPFLEATTLGILPRHILGDVPPGELPDHPFNRRPVGTGPFAIVSGSDWKRTGTVQLIPNPTYWRQGMQLDLLEFRFYEDGDALAEAFRNGEIQAITELPAAILPELATLPGIRLFTANRPRFTELLVNLSELGSAALKTKETRRALLLALDRERMIDNALNGQGLVMEGPYLPTTWAFNPNLLTPHPFRPDEASALLEAAGWIDAEGSGVRQLDGQSLSLRLLVADQPTHIALASEIADLWRAVGVGTEVIAVSLEENRRALSEQDFDVALVDVEPPGDPDLYDFWSQEAIIEGQNYGAWNNRLASESLEAGRQLTDIDARRPFYEAFLRFYDDDLPALSLFQHTYTYAISDSVQQADIGRIDFPRDRFQTLSNWFLLYREIAVSCEETSG